MTPPPPPTEAANAEALVLPRPNPGPEPWDDGASGIAWWALTLAAAAVLAWSVRRLRRRTSGVAPPPAGDASTDDLLLALRDRLRADLAARLGASLHSQTTEELTADPRVVELFGADLPILAEILAAGDRRKFARLPDNDLADRLPAWSAWASSRR